MDAKKRGRRKKSRGDLKKIVVNHYPVSTWVTQKGVKGKFREANCVRKNRSWCSKNTGFNKEGGWEEGYTKRKKPELRNDERASRERMYHRIEGNLQDTPKEKIQSIRKKQKEKESEKGEGRDGT